MTGITSLTVTVDYPASGIRGNKRGVWQMHADAIKAARHAAYCAARNVIIGKTIAGDVKQARLFVTELRAPDQGHVDDDNIIFGLKHSRDGIADALDCADKYWLYVGPLVRERKAEGHSEIIVRLDWSHTVEETK